MPADYLQWVLIEVGPRSFDVRYTVRMELERRNLASIGPASLNHALAGAS